MGVGANERVLREEGAMGRHRNAERTRTRRCLQAQGIICVLPPVSPLALFLFFTLLFFVLFPRLFPASSRASFRASFLPFSLFPTLSTFLRRRTEHSFHIFLLIFFIIFFLMVFPSLLSFFLINSDSRTRVIRRTTMNRRPKQRNLQRFWRK